MSMASDEHLSFPLHGLLLMYLEEILVFQRNVASLGAAVFQNDTEYKDSNEKIIFIVALFVNKISFGTLIFKIFHIMMVPKAIILL